MSEKPEEKMTRQEWIGRCAARLRTLGHTWMTDDRAGDLAKREADLNGESGLAWRSPEDVAEEDMAAETEA